VPRHRWTYTRGMSTRDADIIIAGAGLSGLSLAVRLIEHGPSKARIVVIDPRTEFGRDRTWCQWQVEPHPFEHCISHRWSRWMAADSEGEVVRSAPAHPYVHIPSDRFYADALSRLDVPGARVELRLGTAVERVASDAEAVFVHTDDGAVTSGAMLFDSRPMAGHVPQPNRAGRDREHVVLLQHFAGVIARCSRPVLDPECATIMDFRVPQSDGIHFLYILPYSPRRALVEATWFSARTHDEAAYRTGLERALDRVFGRTAGSSEKQTDPQHDLRVPPDVRVEAYERGVIPMTTRSFRRRSGLRHIRLGLSGGMARPSTGYAFLSIQRDSAALVEEVNRTGLHALETMSIPRTRSVRSKHLDAVFLGWLERHPGRAPALFRTLFERVPPEVLVRFLSDASSPLEDLQVVARCPMASFVEQAVQHVSARVWPAVVERLSSSVSRA